MIISSASGLAFPEWDLVMSINLVSVILKYELGWLGGFGVYVVERWGTLVAYVFVPFSIGFEYLTKTPVTSALRNPLLLGCLLLSVTSLVPTLLHVALIGASILFKPILVFLAVVGRQASRVFAEDAEKFSALLMAATKVAVFLGMCGLSFFGVWGVLAF
jgi:hypothetical protein